MKGCAIKSQFLYPQGVSQNFFFSVTFQDQEVWLPFIMEATTLSLFGSIFILLYLFLAFENVCVCMCVRVCVCICVCVCECMGSCSVAQFCLTLSTPWTVTNQAFLSMEWVTISYSRDLPNPGLELCLLHPLHWPEDSLALCHRNFPRKCNQTQKTFIFRNHYHCLSNSSLEHKEICVFLGLGKQNEPP